VRESVGSIPDFRTDAVALSDELVALRRALHAEPEIGLHLPRTQRRVLDAIAGLPLDVHVGEKLSSVVAVLRGERPGPAVLLRGDMDALPIAEATGLEYAATNGAMHACGHDLHTAGLVGAVRLLAARRASLAGTVIFAFQPGEEGAGGAKIMLDEGLLDVAGERPVASYAIHVAPGPRGVFGTRPGAMAAGSNVLNVVVHGRGGHGSQPHLALDPVPVAAEIVLALQSFVTRRFDATDPIVLSVTRLSTGEGAVNVIPETVELAATIRIQSAASLHTLSSGLPRLVEGIAAAHGLTASADFQVLYPVTTNAPEPTAAAFAVLRDTFGVNSVMELPEPMMTSEDFSYILDEIPGTFVGLAASPPGLDPATVAWNHSPHVVFDDAVLADQAAALATLAYARTAAG
jgi:hippurate hydrolase